MTTQDQSNVASVRTLSVESTIKAETITVKIGLNNAYEVKAEGTGGYSVEEVINAAVEKLQIDTNIIVDGKLTQNVYVGTEKVDDLDYRVQPGQTVVVDERKENG